MTREEALQVLKERMDYYDREKRMRAAIEVLVPEFAEKEDDRIRQVLCDIVRDVPFMETELCARGLTVERVLDYLEKQKEQIPYTDFVIKPHKGSDNNPYDMRASEAQEYAINRGFGIPFNDGEVYVDVRHMTQTIGNIIRWADEHPKEQKSADKCPEYCVRSHCIGCPIYEKQKEQKSSEWDKLQEKFRNINEAFEDGKKEVIEHPGKYGLQKPAECKATINGEPIATENQSVDIPLADWSEEDEANFAWFDKFFRAESVVANGRDIPQDKYLWFKSLRTQPKKELSIDKAIKWFDDTFYFLDNSSGRGRYCEITTHDFDSLEEMYASFRKAVMVDSKHHWKPTETDVALFNKAVTTNKALTPAERAQLDIIRSKFGCCRAVNCKGIVQKEQTNKNEENKFAPSKWIPATNPPENSELVITCSNDNGTPQCIGLSKYVNGKWYDLMGDEDEGYFNVDYWMPIPMF